MVAPMDYTPVWFPADGRRRVTTDAFELALAVIFELRERLAFVSDYLRDRPRTWDETRFIDGARVNSPSSRGDPGPAGLLQGSTAKTSRAS